MTLRLQYSNIISNQLSSKEFKSWLFGVCFYALQKNPWNSRMSVLLAVTTWCTSSTPLREHSAPSSRGVGGGGFVPPGSGSSDSCMKHEMMNTSDSNSSRNNAGWCIECLQSPIQKLELPNTGICINKVWFLKIALCLDDGVLDCLFTLCAKPWSYYENSFLFDPSAYSVTQLCTRKATFLKHFRVVSHKGHRFYSKSTVVVVWRSEW